MRFIGKLPIPFRNDPVTQHPKNPASNESQYHTHRFSHHAMATLFEVLIVHDDAGYAEQAAFAAFQESDRLEQELSRFIENSDISRINKTPANQPVQIEWDTLACLKQSLLLSKLTHNAFDVTARSGENRVEPSIRLDEDKMTVTRLSDSVRIDLGGIGKGYAVDLMADILKDWEIGSALIHGGASSTLASSAPPGEKGWKVTVSRPENQQTPGGSEHHESDIIPEISKGIHDKLKPPGVTSLLDTLFLKNRALSGSGLQKGPHIVDPRTGRPVSGIRAAWALAPDGTTSDALSTTFMVMDIHEIEILCSKNPYIGAMVLYPDKRGQETILKCRNWEG